MRREKWEEGKFEEIKIKVENMRREWEERMRRGKF